MRRHRLVEWLVAALLGCACVAPYAGWRVWQRVELDGERRTVEQSLAQLRAPLARRQRLAREADERRARLDAAREQAKPLARLVRLLDGLAVVDVAGLALDRVAHRAQDTQLQATVMDDAPRKRSAESVAAVWTEHLRTLPEVRSVSVRELKRVAGGAPTHKRQPPPLQLSVQLVWAGAAAGDSRAAASRASAGERGRRSAQ